MELPQIDSNFLNKIANMHKPAQNLAASFTEDCDVMVPKSPRGEILVRVGLRSNRANTCLDSQGKPAIGLIRIGELFE